MINVRLEAYKIILKVLSKKIFSDKLLSQMRKKILFAGEDSQLLYVLVKGIIKMRKNLDFIATHHTDRTKWENTNIKFKILIYIGLYQIIYCDGIPEHAAVNETVNLAKKQYGDKIAKFINAVLRSYLRNPELNFPTDPNAKFAVQYSFPQSLIDNWIDNWGTEKTEKLCRYFNEVPRLHIRINSVATSRSRLTEYFNRREILVEESAASQNMLLGSQPQKILNDVAFSEGYYSIQDTSAALVVELMKPQMQESVLDLFAAPGGKATYIAEFMANTGEVIAIDKFPNKIKKLKQALERLKLVNVKEQAIDAFNFGPVAPAYDRVLLDVPCSGWGVFQKKAELRWQENQDIPKLLKLQEAALKLGASFTIVGGYLIYSTCTMNEQENERQVEKFLAKNRNFKLIPAESFLGNEYTRDGFLKTLPFEHKMDGAFAAKMQRMK
ncbi:16S rRNA (cytosine(967)-C(5))-methyltransferase RsmB [Candidatus Cloacimonadota bacterium]